MRRKHVMAIAVAGVAVGLLIAGTRFSFAADNSASNGAAGCAAVHQQIASGGNVNVAQAIQCDQQEFQALENARQAARAAGQQPAMQNSATCQAVNARAAKGDATLDFNLAFHCRQRERFANTVNAQNGDGAAKQVTSLCQGVQARLSRGENVDAFQQTFCGQEAQAAGQALTGGAKAGAANGAKAGNGNAANPGSGNAANPGNGNAANPGNGANAGNTGNAGAGQVVCQGDTVTTNGLGGAPGAASGTFPLGTTLRITNLDNNKSVIVPVTEVSGSCALLNTAAFEQVREPGKFLIRRVVIERVG
ncbi:septal ring lytic transglycosylase RlpA family protein [Planosporangium flavigriseum]|uniref:Secreted protein n=1 Tax=Planosporangium flavigriseum TaxID=373681 RepID=A0A8J3LNK1_9ACTN|nr:septal ring lytic transglycosylase RlpA family protein [Planosporangium flavigriseum]GIG76433.1 hypothetical protein Pfl04_48370 [Planosporangium flavigriseum]